VVITTAAVPGRKAPVLVTAAMVDAMADGAVVVDMAADQGGNCEVTEAGQIIDRTGTQVVGMANPPAGMPTHASFLFSRNVANILGVLGKEGRFEPDYADEIVIGTCVLRDGQVAHGPTAEQLGLPHAPIIPPAPAQPAEASTS
jgi:NAD(P) transhydrogenase subunit alpha